MGIDHRPSRGYRCYCNACGKWFDGKDGNVASFKTADKLEAAIKQAGWWKQKQSIVYCQGCCKVHGPEAREKARKAVAAKKAKKGKRCVTASGAQGRED